MDKLRVLFLCTENAARSQMAEAFLNEMAPESYQAFSAGLDISPIHPLTIQVMREYNRNLDFKPFREFSRNSISVSISNNIST